MYIVNTSFMVEPVAHDRWLDLIKNHYIPTLRSSGFDSVIFTRVISNDDTGHHTYSIQVSVSDMSEYKRLTGELFDEYIKSAHPLFGDKVLYFTTLLKHIEL